MAKESIESQIMEQLENSDNKVLKKIEKKIKKYYKDDPESILGKISDILVFKQKEYGYKRGFYDAFKEMLSDESREKLDILDKTISDIENSLEWRVMPDYSLRYEDNFVNQSDPEFATHDTYYIYYDPLEGYFVDEGKPYNGYFAGIKARETRYMESNKEILQKLHEARVERHNFLNKNYELSSNNYENLSQIILSYLAENNELVRLKSHAGLSSGYDVLEIEETNNVKNNSLEGMTIEELIKLTQQKDITLEDNNETIKQKLIQELIKKQKKIEEQEAEIQRLKSQKELSNE